MNENEFLASLVKEVEEGVLPFHEADWQQLQARMDEKKERKLLPLIPLRWRYLSLGAAAALILVFGLLYHPEKNTERNTPPSISSYTEKHVQKNEQAAHTETALQKAKPPAAMALQKNETAMRKKGMKKKLTVVPVALSSDMEKYSYSITSVQKQEAEEKTDVDIATAEEPSQENNNLQEKESSLPLWNEVHFHTDKSVIYAGGGVNYGAQAMGYAVKLGLEKPLTTRFSVHTALAVNTNNRNFTVNEIDKIIPKVNLSTSGNYTTYDTLYKQSHRDFAQAFAQALVGVDYKLYKNGKLGLSADAVRLLKSRQQADAFNEKPFVDKTTALWNVGLRLQYTQRLTRHFDIGTLYRQDVSSKINKTWENNFFQLLFIYKVGNRVD